jgi:PPOX class probable F420-dependent enzyme
VPTGSCGALSELPERAARVLEQARRAVLATVDRGGDAHAVPVCFAVRGTDLVTPVDFKPKSGKPLARLRNIEATRSATLLFDSWSEDWERLAWVMVRGAARLDSPGSADAALAERYAQYAERPPGGPVIVVTPGRIVWWTAAGSPRTRV